MPSIPDQPADLDHPAELVAAIRARRGGALLNLDRMLLHSPALAAAWNSYLGAVRGALELSDLLRELAICTVAVHTGAAYEYAQHAPLLLTAGASAEQLDALRHWDQRDPAEQLFTTPQQAVIRLAEEMTRSVQVEETTLKQARAALASDRQLVELVGVIATYNMVARFLVALGIEPEPTAPPAT